MEQFIADLVLFVGIVVILYFSGRLTSNRR